MEISGLKLVAHKRVREPPCKASLPCGAVVAHLQSNSSIATSTVDSIICEQLVWCTAQSLDRCKAQSSARHKRRIVQFNNAMVHNNAVHNTSGTKQWICARYIVMCSTE